MTDWEEDCLKERGEVLKGEYGHWCNDFDGLTVDETTDEWTHGCTDFEDVERAECPDDCHCKQLMDTSF